MNARKLIPLPLLLAAGSVLAQPKADLVTYDKEVLPLLDKYCMDCHDAETKKGRFDLENLSPDFLFDDDALKRPVSHCGKPKSAHK